MKIASAAARYLLLLKEQENDRMSVETELKQKQVKVAELGAEATKVQQITRAEGSGPDSAPSDSGQYPLLPLADGTERGCRWPLPSRSCGPSPPFPWRSAFGGLFQKTYISNRIAEAA